MNSGRPAPGAVRDAVRRGPSPGGLDVLGVLGGGLLLAVIAAQVASGLHPRPIGLAGVVVLLLTASALAFAARAHPLPRAAAALGAAAVTGYAAEWVGVRTGLPFGDYGYTGLLRPQLGGVPVVVALAWGGMGLAAHATAAAAAPGSRAARIGLGALALTAWDLFLDPQMVRLGLWTWHDPGLYRGVPAGNFVGWLVVSLLVMAVIEAALTDPGARSAGLVAIYTAMAFMETLGFAAVFDPPDPLVAAVGGACMGLFSVLAWRRAWRR
ncbi:carotenoid biosynthesis protein [Streptosporangium sp. NPDC003464]